MNKLSILILTYALTVQAYKIPLPLNTDSVLKTNVVVNKNESKVNYRLPTSVKPSHYQIRLTPYLEEGTDKSFTFDGYVNIKVDIIEDVKNIVFHARDLNFTAKDVILSPNNGVPDLSLSFDNKTDFATISKKGDFKKGAYNIEINYKGILNDDLRGFYRSYYINDQKQKVWLATTHFEPVGARRAFPCFDEPSFKATFSISIIHDKKYAAIANTPKIVSKTNKESDSNLIETFFKPTPPMSTYLVAFVVSDFEMKIHSENKNFRVGARPNAIQFGDLSLEAGQKLLKELASFTQVDYELEKMDQVAIPQFAAGAMENWGLVLYTENSLLYNEKVLTASGKKNIIETIAHEFAHQWFGDLVSPKWWKYLWLNEGFANFFQSFITQRVYPEWHSVELSVVQNIQTSAFDFDSGATTHPINHDVESPEEISALFDIISYTKAGAVIRMMQHFLTENVFQKGLTNYLTGKNTQHSAANSDDLFNAIQEIVTKEKIELNIPKIMNTWVTSKGYPVIKVARTNDSKSITVTQERFYTYTPSDEEQKNKQLWSIPINYASEAQLDFNKTTADFWLNEESQKFLIDVDFDKWIVLNKQQTGYYRVNYDEHNWNLIIKQLNSEHNQIHLLNRAQLINDALAFTKQNQLNSTTLVQLVNYLQNETNVIAWYPGFKTFTWLKPKFINTENYGVFKKFAGRLLKSVVETVGFDEVAGEDEENLKKLNRATTIEWACKLNVPLDTSCSSKMQEKLESWLKAPENTLSTDLRKTVLCNGLREASFETWEKVLNKSISESISSTEQNELVSALACSSDKHNLEYFLNYTLAENSPLENQTISIVKTISDNSEVGIDVALNVIFNRLAVLLIKARDKTEVFTAIEYISSKITNTTQLEQLENLSDIPKSVKDKALANAKVNIEWLKQNEEILVDVMNTLNSGFAIYSSFLSLMSAMFVIIYTLNWS